jgi:hypothetical protein
MSIKLDPAVSITGHAAILCSSDSVPSILYATGLLKAEKAVSAASATPLSPNFMPPQEQPRALKLKQLAQCLQGAMFRGDNKAMDPGVAAVVETQFVPAARELFAVCVEQSRGMVDKMQQEYQKVRKGHLKIYADTLHQIRQENTFPELQKRSGQLVSDCKATQRPQLQSAKTVVELYNHGEAVAGRYDELFTQVATKTGSHFHKAPRKGLVRVCEKLALTPEPHNWEPERVCDLVRGAIECDSFTTMMNVLRLLRDLDAKLTVTGETGGVEEKIAITRSKGRFGQPTSGGWADIMINFSFANDPDGHICEVQLVHSQLYTVRKNMGAHKTYSTFRAALELCEMVKADPEKGGDCSELESLVWKDPGALPSQMDTLDAKRVDTLEAKLEAQDAKIAEQDAKIAEQDAKIAELEKLMQSVLGQKAL